MFLNELCDITPDLIAGAGQSLRGVLHGCAPTPDSQSAIAAD